MRFRQKVTLSNVGFKTLAPSHCCPYCTKPVGHLGRFWAAWLGVWIHGCDFSNVDLPADTIAFLRKL